MRALWVVLSVMAGPALAQSEPPLPPAAEASEPATPPSSATDGLPGPPDDVDLPYFTPPRGTDRNRVPDLTAEVLAPGEGQFNLFYLQYSRGLLPGLQVSAHFAGYLITLINLTAEYQVVDTPDVRASLQAGAYWFALSQLVNATMLQAHVMPRATLPLASDLDLNLAANFRALVLSLPGLTQNTRDLRAELALIRYDDGGAWILEGRFPLLTHQSMQLDELLGQADVSGSLLLDDLGAWGVVLSRDMVFGEDVHLRIGAGYRNRPGILLIDSVGNLLLQFDVYWR